MNRIVLFLSLTLCINTLLMVTNIFPWLTDNGRSLLSFFLSMNVSHLWFQLYFESKAFHCASCFLRPRFHPHLCLKIVSSCWQPAVWWNPLPNLIWRQEPLFMKLFAKICWVLFSDQEDRSSSDCLFDVTLSRHCLQCCVKQAIGTGTVFLIPNC